MPETTPGYAIALAAAEHEGRQQYIHQLATELIETQETPMVNRSKAKGTSAETDVTRYLQANGFIHTERRSLNGNYDRGDIAGIPGVVIEVKNCAKQELAKWVREAERERDNDNATLGVVWHKQRGKGSPADWFVTMSGAQFTALLREQQGLAPLTADETHIVADDSSDPEHVDDCPGCATAA